MSHSVTALYSDKKAAETAVERLLQQGVSDKDISILMADSTKGKEFGVEVNSKAPEGTATGAVAGGAIGAIAAGLTAVGTIAATGGAGILAAGPIVAALAGGGAGAAAGGLVGGLVGLGFNETEAKLVDKDLKSGSILLTADVPDDWESDVKGIYENTGAKKVTVH